MPIKYLLLVTISGFLIAFDQVTKMYIHTHFSLGETVVVIENFFNLVYARNPGAAFGFLARSHPEFRELFFLIIPVVAMIIILNILRKVPDSDRVQILALSMIFGGAIGNYIDRLRFGWVIDFLEVHWYNKATWPAFNVADSAIVIGVCLLLLLMWKEEKDKRQEKA